MSTFQTWKSCALQGEIISDTEKVRGPLMRGRIWVAEPELAGLCWLSPVRWVFVTWWGSRGWSAASQGSLERTTALWTSRSNTEDFFYFSFTLLYLYLCWTCSVSDLGAEMQTVGNVLVLEEMHKAGNAAGSILHVTLICLEYSACYINLCRIFPSKGLGRCTRLH